MSSCTIWFGSEGNVLIENAIARTGCVVSAGDPVLAGGTLDIVQKRSYSLPLAVTNLLASSTVSGTSGEQNFIQIEELLVHYTDGDSQSEDVPAGGNADGPFPWENTIISPTLQRRTPTTGIIQPGETAVMFVTAVTEDESEQLVQSQIGTEIGPSITKTIIAHMTLSGFTGAGKYTETNTFAFPIDLCAGCLAPVVCPGGNTPEAHPDYDSCFPAGQDIPFTTCDVKEEEEEEG